MDALLIAADEHSLSPTAELRNPSYGKSGIRLIKLERHDNANEFRDLTVNIRMFGNFSSVYVHGDNSLVLPTDTMKNTAYAMAGKRPDWADRRIRIQSGRSFSFPQ